MPLGRDDLALDAGEQGAFGSSALVLAAYPVSIEYFIDDNHAACHNLKVLGVQRCHLV